jgi:hypothetical protein
MKKLCLLIALVASPVFAQEEEQEIQIEVETIPTLARAEFKRRRRMSDRHF